MRKKGQSALRGAFHILLFFTVLLLHSTISSHLRIGRAFPMVILPLLTAFSMFSPVMPAAVAGFLSGLFLDGTESGVFCLNTITLMLIAVFVSVLSDNLFNRNIRSALCLSFFAAVAYFIVKWLALYAFRNPMQDSLYYLLYYGLPSVLYSEVFLFLFYPIYRRIARLKGV